MMFDLPWLCATFRAGPFHFDFGPTWMFPLGYTRISSNLGYFGVRFAVVSWDFRPGAR
jgi:hypothetical protein